MKKFMVIERFKDGCLDAAYDRFHSEGRLLPDGLNYVNSWANRRESVCFQLMESADPDLFETWFERWQDLVDFEVFEID